MNLVDDYLQQLDAQLGEVPPPRRAEILEEARTHLEALLAARRADGLSEAAAWQSAQTAFGEAELVGRELAREWARDPRIETVGTPLSAERKRRKIVGFGALLVVYLTFLALTPVLIERDLAGPFLLLLVPLVFGLKFRQLRTTETSISPATTFGLILGALVTLILALRVQFSAELRNTPLGAALDTYFSPIVIGVFLLAIWWSKREDKQILPWRRTRNYALSPVAAEEEHRLNLAIGRIGSAAIPCIMALWLGWQSMGMPHALMMCAGIVGFNLLIWRWIR